MYFNSHIIYQVCLCFFLQNSVHQWTKYIYNLCKLAIYTSARILIGRTRIPIKLAK